MFEFAKTTNAGGGFSLLICPLPLIYPFAPTVSGLMFKSFAVSSATSLNKGAAIVLPQRLYTLWYKNSKFKNTRNRIIDLFMGKQILR